MYRNTAGRHITVKDNSDRPLRLLHNTPDPLT
jgi:hypothetical protein